MKYLKAILVDDEFDALSLLQIQIAKYCPHIINSVTTFSDPEMAVESIKQLKPDILFLDIVMPSMTGFELLTQLLPLRFPVIFVTAYNQFAIKAFKFNAIDYLVKPVDATDLVEAVMRIQEKKALDNTQIDGLSAFLKGEEVKKMAISTQQGVSFIDLDQIIYIEADSNYSTVILISGKRIIISKTLKELEELLEESHFLRIHRQYIINLNHVEHLDRTKSILRMINKDEVLVSRNIKDKLMTLYKWI